MKTENHKNRKMKHATKAIEVCAGILQDYLSRMSEITDIDDYTVEHKRISESIHFLLCEIKRYNQIIVQEQA